MNIYLCEIESFHTCPEMHEDFMATSKRLCLNGLFNADIIIGTLESKKCKHILKVLPYLGASADRAVTSLNPCTTSTVSPYCEILRRV